MEYVEGGTLYDVAEQAPLPIPRIVEIAIEIAEALDEAHRRGLVHRDLKPANLMLTSQGHVKVMDFGLAKQVHALAADAAEARTVLTDAGTRVGTPSYMSPEQILGAPLDARSDIFSLGIVLYELATGDHPFGKADAAGTMAAILRDPPVGGARDLDEVPALAAVVRRMLAKACAERPQSMRDVRAQLDALRDARGTTTSIGEVAAADAAERTPFVGREAETAELWWMLDRMLTGQGGLVLIGGEPGVGKTRLSRELQRVARQRGCLCLTGHCYEMEGAPSFVPFVEITEEAARLVPRAVRIAMGDEAPEIASIVPSLRRTYDDIDLMPELPTEQRRQLVFNGMLEYLRRGAQKSPGVLLLDDLHWADGPSLQFLSHLAPHLPSMRLLVVGTYRDVELDVGRPFARTLEGLLRQRLATRIALRRLDEAGVGEMLSAMSGSAPPSGLSRVVFRETEGNPFFVEEVYQHLAEEGRLFDESGQWKADLRVGAVEVPEGVRLVVGRRLDRLGEQARKVLTAAAVIGRTFPLDVLLAAAGVPEDDVLDALEQAERAQLVTIDASRRMARYAFVHELIRTTLVDGLSFPRRQRMHLRIADALERAGASADRPPSVLAHHLFHAGAAADVQRTAAALAAAGRAADEAGAFEETIEICDNLVSLELPDSDPLVAGAYLRRGVALAGLRRYDEAIAAFERALDLHAALGDDAGISASATGASLRLFWLGRSDGARLILERGLAALSAGARAERALVESSLGAALAMLARLDEGLEHIDTATRLATECGDPHVLGTVLASRVTAERACGDLRAAGATTRQALALLGDADPYARVELMLAGAIEAAYLGRGVEMVSLLKSAEDLARRIGHHAALWLLRWAEAVSRLSRDGDLTAFLTVCDELVDRAESPHVNQLYAAATRLYLGDEARALEMFEAAAGGPDRGYLNGMSEGCLFVAAALSGPQARARSLAPAVEAWLPTPGRRNTLGSFLAVLSLAPGLAWLGDTEHCARLYPLTRLVVENGFRSIPFLAGPTNAHLAAALAADAGGLIAKADEHFAAAAADAREIPIRILQPTVLAWHGRSIAGRPGTGERERGRAMVAAALEDFRALRMVPHARLAERFLREGR